MWSGGGTKRRSQCSGTTGFRDPGGFRDEVRVNSFTDGAVSVSRNPARQMTSRGGGRGVGMGCGVVGCASDIFIHVAQAITVHVNWCSGAEFRP